MVSVLKTLILAAGYAIRLYPLTKDTPKPLLEVAGRKIIERILDKVLRVEGIRSIYIISNDKFFEKFNLWLESSKYRGKASLINDGSVSNETRLGAIKDLDIALKVKSKDDDLLVIAGDNLFEFDLDEFLGFSRSRRDGVSIALHDIGDPSAARRFGVVSIDSQNRIVDFEEKPRMPKSTLVSTAIYYFPKEKLPSITAYLEASDKVDAPGYYISWLSRTDKVYGFIFSEDWYDIGDIESLKKADSRYSTRKSLRDNF